MKSAKNADLMVFATNTYFPVFDFLRETEKNYKKKLCPHHYIHSEADEFLVLPITYFIFLCLFYFFPFHQKEKERIVLLIYIKKVKSYIINHILSCQNFQEGPPPLTPKNDHASKFSLKKQKSKCHQPPPD